MKQSNASGRRPIGTGRDPGRAGKSRGVWAAPILLLLTFLATCGGKIPPTFYYQLHLPDPPASGATPSPATALIMPFKASEMLTQDRIVYRPSPEEVGFYEYHRWAEDPRTTVTSSFHGQLRRRGTFSRVVGFDGRTQADYLIRGRIERLEEVDYGGEVTVRARLSLDLLELSTRETVWQGVSENSQPVQVAEVRSVVTQMSAAMRMSIDKLAADLDAFVRAGGLAGASSDGDTQPSQ